MTAALEITPATADDVPQLAALLEELFTLEQDFAPDRSKQERGLRLILERPEFGRILVARDAEGAALGMANLLFTPGGALWLEDVIVRRDCRGQGLGQALVRRAAEAGRAEGYDTVCLMADSANGAALRFYAREGFRRQGAVAMRLSLAD